MYKPCERRTDIFSGTMLQQSTLLPQYEDGSGTNASVHQVNVKTRRCAACKVRKTLESAAKIVLLRRKVDFDEAGDWNIPQAKVVCGEL